MTLKCGENKMSSNKKWQRSSADGENVTSFIFVFDCLLQFSLSFDGYSFERRKNSFVTKR